jgi:hypothetical protein
MTGIEIQNGFGHCSLEDAKATREVSLIYIRRKIDYMRAMKAILPPLSLGPAPEDTTATAQSVKTISLPSKHKS